jgi:hypothetical protein
MRVNKRRKNQRPGENSMPPKRAKQGQTTQTGLILSGLKLNIEVRPTNTETLKDFFASQPSLSHGEDRISMFKEVLPQKFRDKALNLDTGFTLKNWEPLSSTNDTLGWLTLETGGAVKKVKAYKKVMPLVDATGWMRYKERPSKPFFWMSQPYDILEAENQAYVDCVASYMASKLKERLHSPHFCTFYGCVRAVTDTYLYNLEDDFEEFRFTKWFWQGVEAGEFNLRIVEKHTGRRLSLDEIKTLSKPDDEFLHDDDESESNSDTTTDESDEESLGAESLPEKFHNQRNITTTVQEVSFDDLPFSSTNYRSTTPKTASTIQTSSTDSDQSFAEEYYMHAEFKEMPVAIQYLEACEGTFDSLLESKDLAPIKNTIQQEQWIAWLFQICVALSQLQNALRLTHNDLHSSNILWKKTDIQYLYYADSKGRKWQVPTHGYIFTIIDYGRSIFSLNNYFIISSDYNDGHDACGMYNFGPIEDKSQPRVGPNPSFDLCRLACDMLRALYPTNPAPSNPKSKLITKEGSWEVRETDHAFFNLLWTWLKTRQNTNVLETESGAEKYPGFELYAVIAKDVQDAVPEAQVSKPIFKSFEITDMKGIQIQQYIIF